MTPEDLAIAVEALRSPLKQPIRRWDRSMARPTVGQLVLWCADHGLGLDEVQVTGSEISWTDIETSEERDKRIAHWRVADQAREDRKTTFELTPMEDQWPTRSQTTS